MGFAWLEGFRSGNCPVLLFVNAFCHGGSNAPQNSQQRMRTFLTVRVIFPVVGEVVAKANFETTQAEALDQTSSLWGGGWGVAVKGSLNAIPVRFPKEIFYKRMKQCSA